MHSVKAVVISFYFLLFASSQICAQTNFQSSAALLVIDVQNCFVDGGSLPVPSGAEVIPVINKIAPFFQNIIVTQDWHPGGHISFASAHQGAIPFEVIKLPYGEQVLWPNHCIQGSKDAALHPELDLPNAQLILRKGFHKDVDSYSAFMEADRKTSSGLAAYLRDRQIDAVYIVGLATDFCVAWTALDARDAGFSVYVVEDATRAINSGKPLESVWHSLTSRGVNRIQSEEIYFK